MRLDSHVAAGYKVPPYYDSMVAKLLVHQPTREEAFAVMRRALREFKVEGVHTTIPIHQKIFETPEFQNIVPWLMLNREGLDVLVHPLTESSYDDHSKNALWLGTPQPLRDALARTSGGMISASRV